MRHYKGTEKVEPGLYFNPRQWSFKSMDDEGPLPGTKDETYRRVPMLALLFAGPFLGLAYVIFLPFIGFAMVGWLLGVKAAHLAAGALRGATRVLRPGWEPSMAFLSRSKPTKAAKATRAEADEWAAEAEKKMDRRERDAT